MSNFPALDDDFGNGFGSTEGGASGQGAGDVDSFLARERAALGEDADAFGGAPPVSEEGAPTGADSLMNDDTEPASSSGGRFDVSAFSRDAEPQQQSNVNITGTDEMSAFEQQYPDVQPSPAQPAFTNGYGASPYGQPAPPTPLPPMQLQQEEEETEPIREWRERQEDSIRERDAAAQASKEEIIAKAERAIDDFYAEYNAKKEKQIAKNKEEEAAFLEERNDALGKGTAWQRVAELCELQDSRSKTNTRATRDVSRMKELFLALKREGDTAPGAAGY